VSSRSLRRPAPQQLWPRPVAPSVEPDLEGDLIAALGSSLTHFWIAAAAHVTLSGANVSTIADLHTEVAHPLARFSYVSGAPIWEATGGPGGRACINLSTASSALTANLADRSAGNRQALYTVCALPGTVADVPLFITRATDGIAGSARMIIGQSGTGKNRGLCVFTGGAQDISSTAAADSNWHLFAIRPLAAGASFQIDGTEVSPTFTGTDTVPLVGACNIGHGTAAGGKWACGLTIDAPTTGQNNLIKAYVTARFGIATA
jgi:hypothetical protein